jgi:RNA polymerase primary sigma factor
MVRGNNKRSAEQSFYIEQMKRYPLLSAEEEKELAAKIKAGDPQAKQHLVNCNLRLARSIAYKYIKNALNTTGMSYDDLIQEGNIGLLTAAEKFDGERNTRFASFATSVISQRILYALREQGRSIRLPAKVISGITKYNYIVDELCAKLSRQPTAQEIADTMKVPVKTVIMLQQLDNYSNDDCIIKNGETATAILHSVADTKGVNVEDEVIDNISRDNLMEQTNTVLNERERFVLYERNGCNDEQKVKTHKEIGGVIGTTEANTQKIAANAAAKLRAFNGRMQYIYDLRRQNPAKPNQQEI